MTIHNDAIDSSSVYHSISEGSAPDAHILEEETKKWFTSSVDFRLESNPRIIVHSLLDVSRILVRTVYGNNVSCKLFVTFKAKSYGYTTNGPTLVIKLINVVPGGTNELKQINLGQIYFPCGTKDYSFVRDIPQEIFSLVDGAHPADMRTTSKQC